MIRHNGIIILPRDRAIRHRDQVFRFHSRRKIHYVKWELAVHLILAGGLSPEQLFDLLYRHDPEGGPLSGKESIKTLMWQSFKIYAALRLSLKSEVRGGTQYYSLVPQGTPGAEVFEFRGMPKKKNQWTKGRPRKHPISPGVSTESLL